MKLHPHTGSTLNTVTAYGEDYVEINTRRHERPIVLMPEEAVAHWPVAGFESLEPRHFELLLPYRPELVLLGTGRRQRFPHPRLTRTLTDARIGVEVMDTQAACRTYNILMTEGRRVMAALLL